MYKASIMEEFKFYGMIRKTNYDCYFFFKFVYYLLHLIK